MNSGDVFFFLFFKGRRGNYERKKEGKKERERERYRKRGKEVETDRYTNREIQNL